jgi:DNA-binding XRE family transcriptional regulator
MYEKLKELREKKGYTIEDMARVINKSPCNYFKKENGDVKFSVNEALEISNFLKTKVEKIFFKDELSESEIK